MSMNKILKKNKADRDNLLEKNKALKGYWLVREYDNERFYISERINGHKLEQVADKVLNDKTGYGYWIDYCLGIDITGRVAWSNMDQTDSFF